jgi:hypothetical protein
MARSVVEVLAQPVEHVVAGLTLGLREGAEGGGAVVMALAARLPLVDWEAGAQLELRGEDSVRRRVGSLRLGWLITMYSFSGASLQIRGNLSLWWGDLSAAGRGVRGVGAEGRPGRS